MTVHTLLGWSLYLGYRLLLITTTLRVLGKRRVASSLTSWLLMMYVAPPVGITFYFMVEELKLDRLRIKRSKSLEKFISDRLTSSADRREGASLVSGVALPLFKLCEHRLGTGGLLGEDTLLLTDGDDVLRAIVEDINSARESVEMIFYIWEEGGLVDQVIATLIAAAQRGVRCRVMLDSAGSSDFFRSSHPEIMRESGIRVVEALRLNLLCFFLRRMDLRQHRKVIIVDDHVVYTGSMNMVDPHVLRRRSGGKRWTDLMIRTTGDVASVVGAIFAHDWEIETGEKILLSIPTPGRCRRSEDESRKQQSMQVIASGPGFPANLIHQTLLTAICSARRSLTITTPYLIPSEDLLLAICTAAQRGVNVRIIVPLHNDSAVVDWTSRAFFDELLDAGVQMYQFEKGLLHSKSITVDNQLSLLGTFNLDMRSLWLNFEIILAIDDSDFSEDLSRIQDSYIEQSRRLKVRDWLDRPHWHRILEHLSCLFSSLL